MAGQTRITLVLPDGLSLDCVAARGFWMRLRGLIGQKRSAWEGRCLLFEGCSCLHTFGMGFDLDMAFLDEKGVIIAARRGVPPWRIAGAPGAVMAVERPAERSGWMSVGEVASCVRKEA